MRPRHEEHDELAGDPVRGEVDIDTSSWEDLEDEDELDTELVYDDDSEADDE